MRRTGIKRRTPMPQATKPLRLSGAPKRRRPLRRQSANNAAGERQLAKARSAVIERSGGMCEIKVPGVCLGRGRHAHHIQLRSAGGKHTPANLAWTCELCHSHIHSHPEWAKANGFIRSAA